VDWKKSSSVEEKYECLPIITIPGQQVMRVYYRQHRHKHLLVCSQWRYALVYRVTCVLGYMGIAPVWRRSTTRFPFSGDASHALSSVKAVCHCSMSEAGVAKSPLDGASARLRAEGTYEVDTMANPRNSTRVVQE
jgi:hypothetical protein